MVVVAGLVVVVVAPPAGAVVGVPGAGWPTLPTWTARLLAGVPSLVRAETWAVFVAVPDVPAATATVSVTVRLAPGARAPPWVHVTVAPAARQVHPAPPADTNDRPDGSVSTTVSGPRAGSDPVLVTVSAYWAVPPGVSEPISDLVSVRSATAAPAAARTPERPPSAVTAAS